MAIDLGYLDCQQSKPFDLRRERRYHYRLWKQYPTSKKEKRAAGVLQSIRQFCKTMQAQQDAVFSEGFPDY